MAIRSSGILNADAAITTKNGGFLHGVLLVAATADCTLAVYDGDASGDVATAKGLASLAIDVSLEGGPTHRFIWFGDRGVKFTDGLYADVTGTGATYIVYYS